MIKKAKQFALEKHKGQKRKFSSEDYSEHPLRVAEIVKKYKKSHKINELVCAALLHDTLENTNTKESELRELFGDLVASLVKDLSSNKEEIKKTSKKEYLSKKMSHVMSSWALVIKLADRLDNINSSKKIESLNEESNKFSNKYYDETKHILENLEKNRKLSKTQQKLVNEIREKLK